MGLYAILLNAFLSLLKRLYKRILLKIEKKLIKKARLFQISRIFFKKALLKLDI